MAIISLNEENFVESVAKENTTAFIEIYADWCKPCQKMFPIVKELSEEYSDISFYKIDADVELLLAATFKAFTLPTFVFTKDGVVRDVLSGVVTKEELQDCIEKLKTF